jgi:hypothetical protein
MTSSVKIIDFNEEEEDFIALPELPKEWLIEPLTKETMDFINRGSCDTEPVELQLKN